MINQKKLGQKIKELREGIGISQDDLAKKVGLSRVAISQIECGNRSIEALELAKVANFFGLDMDYILRDEQSTGVKVKSRDYVCVGNEFKFSAEKLKNVILYILEKCGGKPNIGETVLYKLLYFIDFDNVEINGKPITGMNYIRLQYGPVPMAKEYNKVVGQMVSNNELKIFSQQYFGRLQKRYVALRNSDVSFLTVEEISVIDKVVNRLSDLSATQVEAYVHEDIPWKVTKDKQIIPYDLVIDREPPYAHKDYNQMWQDAAGADALKHLGPISKEEYDYYSNL